MDFKYLLIIPSSLSIQADLRHDKGNRKEIFTSWDCALHFIQPVNFSVFFLLSACIVHGIQYRHVLKATKSLESYRKIEHEYYSQIMKKLFSLNHLQKKKKKRCVTECMHFHKKRIQFIIFKFGELIVFTGSLLL